MTRSSSALVPDHRSLKVWQVAMSLAEDIYRSTRAFPAAEKFGLTSQVRRAAVSIASNIAEGNGRASTKEYVHHLSIARGSLREVSTLVDLSTRLGYLAKSDVPRLEELENHIGRMLTRLIKSLQAPGRR